MTSYIAPALTPASSNPSFRVYTIDPHTFAILDYAVFAANMSLPSYQTGPVFTQLYSVKEAYGSRLEPPVVAPQQALTPAFWHNVTTLFERDDDVFMAYRRRKARIFRVGPEATCDAECKKSEICQLRAALGEYNWFVLTFHFPHCCLPSWGYNIVAQTLIFRFKNSDRVSAAINFKKRHLDGEHAHGHATGPDKNRDPLQSGECHGSTISPILRGLVDIGTEDLQQIIGGELRKLKYIRKRGFGRQVAGGDRME